MKRYYVFVRLQTGFIFWTTTFADSCSDAVYKEFNPVHLQKRYGTGIMFATLKDHPKRSNGSARSF